MKPTDKQVKEFWERFGFNFSHKAENHNFFHGATGTYADFYLYPDGDCGSLPPIDLNNLLKYAVPNRISEVTFMYASNCVSCGIEDLEGNFFEGHVDTESMEEAWEKTNLALFWAIYEVVK